MLKNITANQLRFCFDKIVIIDIREREEFDKKYIPGSVNMDINEIDKVSELILDKNTPIVVCCTSGIRSIAAGERLCEIGYTNVYNLLGGINAFFR
jgi:rhodanese-related sulfurtransferase